MKEGMIIRKLGEVCTFENGDRGKNYPSRTKFISKGIPFINAGHLKYGKVFFSDMNYITEENFNLLSRGKFKKGDLLFCLRGSLGKYAEITFDEPGAIASSLVIVRPGEFISKDFLGYYFQSKICSSMVEKYAGGAAQPNLGAKDLMKFNIPLPPLSEQQQIVTILDKAFAAIDQAKANIEKNIENAKELFQSKLNKTFSQRGEGWEEKRLGEVCKYEKLRHIGNSLPYVGLEDIESNTGKYLGNLEPTIVKSSTFSFSSKHVLYGRLRPYLNKVLLPDFDGHCSTEIFPILPNLLVDRKYLFFWFLSPAIVKKIDATWTGARMPRANMNEVINFKIRIPSISIQKQITKDLDALMFYTFDIELKYNKKLQYLEELKKSILQKAFAGELTAKGIAV